MSNLYILNGDREPVPVPDTQTWAEWYATADRRVALDTGHNYRLSTVFLAISYGTVRGLPQVFETMMFQVAGDGPDRTARYGTWDEALAGHERIKSMIEFERKNKP